MGDDPMRLLSGLLSLSGLGRHEERACAASSPIAFSLYDMLLLRHSRCFICLYSVGML